MKKITDEKVDKIIDSVLIPAGINHPNGEPYNREELAGLVRDVEERINKLSDNPYGMVGAAIAIEITRERVGR